MLPLLPRCGLLAVHDRVPVPPRDEVTGNGGLKIEPGFQVFLLLIKW